MDERNIVHLLNCHGATKKASENTFDISSDGSLDTLRQLIEVKLT